MIAQIDRRYLHVRPWKIWSRVLAYGLFEGRPLTTKGRWINSIVFGQFSFIKVLPRLQKVEKPIFILGTGRSGTTILGIILSMHRRVGYLNEPKAVWHAIHSKEDLIGSYCLGPAKYRLDSIDATPERERIAHKIFGAYLAMSFSGRLVDKYPELIFRVPFVKTLFPDAKFIFLVRDGWDTCHSINQWSGRLGVQKNGQIHDWWGYNDRKWHLIVDQLVPEHEDLALHRDILKEITNHVDRAAVEWIVTMREGLKLRSLLKENLLTIRYEDLCFRPEIILQDISKFLELEDDPTFLKYGIQTLRTSQGIEPLSLNPLISNAFHETMNRLGYI